MIAPLLSFLALICAFLYLMPVRFGGMLTEMLLASPRDGSWNSTPRDQFALSLANSAALRQAQLFNAYPNSARMAVGFLRLVRLG